MERVGRRDYLLRGGGEAVVEFCLCGYGETREHFNWLLEEYLSTGDNGTAAATEEYIDWCGKNQEPSAKKQKINIVALLGN